MPHDYKQYIRFILLFCLLLLPNIATAFLSIDLNYSVIKQLGYLLIVFVLLLIPLLFLKTKPYFIVEGIFNVLLSPIEFASLYLNKQSTTPLFIKTILSTNFGEAQELLQSFWWVVAIVIVGWILYCFLLVKIPNVSLLKGKYKTYAFAFCGAVLFCVYIGQFFLIRHIMPTKTLRASFAETNSCFLMKFDKIFPCNIYIGAYAWFSDTREWEKAQQQVASFRFGIQPRQDMTSACYILYIGEAARYDHFQVNGYHRPTTPYLDTCSNILSFSNIYAQANLTGYSVPFILTRATPSNPEIIYQEKSIVEAFSEAGYQTAFVEKNASSPFIMRILNTCDYHFLYSSGIDGNANYDTEMLVNVKEAYSDKAQMMVLHGLGSHFKYSMRYPASEAYFLPAMTARDGYNASEANKESIINAYDNTIRYTDKALGELIEWGKSLHRPVVILYLSDHGESLWDDERKLALHGSYQMAEAEYHIPFIIWYSNEYAAMYPNKVAYLKTNKHITQTSGIAFHTLLDIADIHEATDSTQSACSPYIVTRDSFPVWNGKGETVTYIVNPQK